VRVSGNRETGIVRLRCHEALREPAGRRERLRGAITWGDGLTGGDLATQRLTGVRTRTVRARSPPCPVRYTRWHTWSTSQSPRPGWLAFAELVAAEREISALRSSGPGIYSPGCGSNQRIDPTSERSNPLPDSYRSSRAWKRGWSLDTLPFGIRKKLL
jgi:hypothetical protein